MDPLFRAQVERDISLLADPEIEMALAPTDRTNVFRCLIKRRRGASMDPDFRFRDPDVA